MDHGNKFLGTLDSWIMVINSLGLWTGRTVGGRIAGRVGEGRGGGAQYMEEEGEHMRWKKEGAHTGWEEGGGGRRIGGRVVVCGCLLA